MSVCAALGYRWDGRGSRLFFQTREGSYNAESLIHFLEDVEREAARAKRHSGVGRLAGPQEQGYEGIPPPTTQMAHGGEPGRIGATRKSGNNTPNPATYGIGPSLDGSSPPWKSLPNMPAGDWRTGTNELFAGPHRKPDPEALPVFVWDSVWEVGFPENGLWQR